MSTHKSDHGHVQFIPYVSGKKPSKMHFGPGPAPSCLHASFLLAALTCLLLYFFISNNDPHKY